MLVVVKHRNSYILQVPFHFEAPGRGNVFQIDAPEHRGNVPDRIDNFIHVLGVQADGEDVNAREVLEEKRRELTRRVR